MENLRTYSSQTLEQGAVSHQHRVLRNTYGLLGLSMLPTVLGALLGVQMQFSFLAGSPFIGFLLFMGIRFLLQL